MTSKTKKTLEKTVNICVCIPGENEDHDLEFNPDSEIETETDQRTTRARKRNYAGCSSASSESSNSNIGNRFKTKKKDINEKPVYLTINQDKHAVKPCSFKKLRQRKYFVDKTRLINEIYTDDNDTNYYCFPRAGTKSTVVDTLTEWLLYDDKTKMERIKCFEDLEIMKIAKNVAGKSLDGVIGFNSNVIIRADFGCVETENRNLDEIVMEVTKEFCSYLVSLYSLDRDVSEAIKIMKADDSSFFPEIISSIRKSHPRKKRNYPVVLIIDNFDAPALRLLNRSKSPELAVSVMNFFNSMLKDVSRVGGSVFSKIFIFGTHQPICLNTKSNLKKIPVISYPYGKKEICSDFFFTIKEVKKLLKNHQMPETMVTELSNICGQYNIYGNDYFHPGSVVNYITRRMKHEEGEEHPVFWCSPDSLDILADSSAILPYEMMLWTHHEGQTFDFVPQTVLIFDNLKRPDNNAGFTYLLEAGYLTETKESTKNNRVFKVVNSEARNLFSVRYRQWCDRIPPRPNNEPVKSFAKGDYKTFFDGLNTLLKCSYAGEDFRFEGQYHVFISSFFHNLPNWHFKSNYQAGYGKYDFVTWDEDTSIDTGYLFEIAIAKPESDAKKCIKLKILEKKKQIEDKEYFLEVKKKKIVCIVAVGCKKMISYAIFNVT